MVAVTACTGYMYEGLVHGSIIIHVFGTGGAPVMFCGAWTFGKAVPSGLGLGDCSPSPCCTQASCRTASSGLRLEGCPTVLGAVAASSGTPSSGLGLVGGPRLLFAAFVPDCAPSMLSPEAISPETCAEVMCALIGHPCSGRVGLGGRSSAREYAGPSMRFTTRWLCPGPGEAGFPMVGKCMGSGIGVPSRPIMHGVPGRSGLCGPRPTLADGGV